MAAEFTLVGLKLFMNELYVLESEGVGVRSESLIGKSVNRLAIMLNGRLDVYRRKNATRREEQIMHFISFNRICLHLCFSLCVSLSMYVCMQVKTYNHITGLCMQV